jgi:hypothetical protein
MSTKISLFSKGMILAAVCSVLLGQTKPDALGFDSGVYDYHFRRADRETSPEGWIAEARQDVRIAKNAWKQIAAELYGDRALLAGSRPRDRCLGQGGTGSTVYLMAPGPLFRLRAGGAGGGRGLADP